jgi:hypothetical protein
LKRDIACVSLSLHRTAGYSIKLKFSFLIKKASLIMKNLKMAFTAAAIFAVVGSALAFKTDRANTSGTLRCNIAASIPAPCEDNIKYVEVSAPQGSPALCNDGLGGSTCDQSKRVVQDDK